jgi:hypothetical protein
MYRVLWVLVALVAVAALLVICSKTTKNSELDARLPIKLSTIGFALQADLCYTSRVDVWTHDERNVERLRHGDQLFISVRETSASIERIVAILKRRGVKLVFFLMDEPVVAPEVVSAVSPVAIRMFVQNSAYELPNVHIMPIGIRDCGTIVAMHAGMYEQRTLLEAPRLTPLEKRHKCLLCFSLVTHESRRACYDALRGLPFVLDLNATAGPGADWRSFSVPPAAVYAATIRSQYVLAPRGTGVDTHRFYEAIYLWSVPIVVRTNSAFDRLYTVFPCLVVAAWTDVTAELLDREYEACAYRLRAFHYRYPRFLTDRATISDLLLRL